MASPKIKEIQVGGRTRFRFVVDIGRDPATGKRRQLTKTFDGKREAEKQLAKILNEVGNGSYVQPGKLTVNAYLDEWLRSATRGKEANTVENYRFALTPVRQRLGEKPLQRLTTMDVENLVDWMLTSGRKRGGQVGTGLSARTVRLTLSRLRAALDSAVHRRLVEFNVAAPVKCEGVSIEREEPWSTEEVKKFLAAIRGERLQVVMLLSLMGLRPAEVAGLRWKEDVDLVAGTLWVRNTRTIVWGESGGQVVEKAPKSKAGKRSLPLPAPVAAALMEFQSRQADEKELADAAYQESGYVLVDELGRPCRTDWFRRRAYKLMVAAGVRRVRLYDARHSCLTYLANEAGVPDTIVSAWAGHADLSLAKKTYNHVSADHLRQGSEALAKLLS